MKRGLAIAIVYVALILFPVLIGAILVPPVVEQLNNLIQNLPAYAGDLQDFVNENDRLRQLEEDYNITAELQKQAAHAARPRRRRGGDPLRHRARARELGLRRRSRSSC